MGLSFVLVLYRILCLQYLAEIKEDETNVFYNFFMEALPTIWDETNMDSSTVQADEEKSAQNSSQKEEEEEEEEEEDRKEEKVGKEEKEEPHYTNSSTSHHFLKKIVINGLQYLFTRHPSIFYPATVAETKTIQDTREPDAPVTPASSSSSSSLLSPLTSTLQLHETLPWAQSNMSQWSVYQTLLKAKSRYIRHLALTRTKRLTNPNQINTITSVTPTVTTTTTTFCDFSIIGPLLSSTIIMYMMQFCGSNSMQSLYATSRKLRNFVMNPLSWHTVSVSYYFPLEGKTISPEIPVQKFCPAVIDHAAALKLRSTLSYRQIGNIEAVEYKKWARYAIDATPYRVGESSNLRTLEMIDWSVEIGMLANPKIFPRLTSLSIAACDPTSTTSPAHVQDMFNRPALVSIRISLWRSQFVFGATADEEPRKISSSHMEAMWKELNDTTLTIPKHTQRFEFYGPRTTLKFRIAEESQLRTLALDNFEISDGLQYCTHLTTLHTQYSYSSRFDTTSSKSDVESKSLFLTQLMACSTLTSLQFVGIIPNCVFQSLSNLKSLYIVSSLVFFVYFLCFFFILLLLLLLLLLL